MSTQVATMKVIQVSTCQECPFFYDSCACHHPDAPRNLDMWPKGVDYFEKRVPGCPLDKEPVKVESACPTCVKYSGQMAPTHRGSRRCESGSLASGGTKTHCTCDTCF